MTSRKRSANSSRSRKNSKDKEDSLLKLTDCNALVGSLLGNHTSLNSSRKSEGKRKSLPFQSESQDSVADEESDSDVTNDEERKEIRKAKATEKNNLAVLKTKEKGEDKSKNFLIHKLSPEELEQHYSQCIQLFSKNKVNVKNAFKLQLIDFMELMIERKTDKSENLVLMSCTLDASAKIYSCRVDNVYSNLTKFVKSYQSGGKVKDGEKNKGQVDSNNSDHSEVDSSDTEQDNKAKKDKKKTSKAPRASFIKESGTLNRKGTEMCYHRQNLPRNQMYFLESSTLNKGSLLVLNRPLFTELTESQPSNSYFTIGSPWKAGVDKDNFEEKIPRYTELRNHVFIVDDGPKEDEVQLCEEKTYAFDPNVESIAEMKNFNEISDGQSEAGDEQPGDEIEMDYDDCDMEPGVISNCDERENLNIRDSEPATDQGSANNLNGLTPRVSFTPVAMLRMLRSSKSKQSDFSFFDDSKVAFMPSAAHWKIKPSKRSIAAVGKTPVQTRKSKCNYLDFFSDNLMKTSLESILEENKVTLKLSIKTTRDWFYKKTDLIYKPIIYNVRQQLLSLFKDPDTCILKVARQSDSASDVCDANESVLLNPVDFGAPETDDIDDDRGDHGGDYHPLEDWRERMDEDEEQNPNPVNQDTLQTVIGDENLDKHNDFLVPQPFIVDKVSVKFAKAQKRIDIKKLKTAIWNVMDLDHESSENKENVKNSETDDKKKKQVIYSDVFNEIPGSITKEAAAELSYPIAFMAILHMANEKNLKLVSNENHSDFSVSLDSPP